MAKFRAREKEFIRAGCLVLRGLKRVKSVRDFQPIQPMAVEFRNIQFATNRIRRDDLKVPMQYHQEHQVEVQRMQKRLRRMVAGVISAAAVDQEQVGVPDLGDEEEESDEPEDEGKDEDKGGPSEGEGNEDE